MSRIVSIHEYVLKAGADPKEFEASVQNAKSQGMLELPGLIDVRFLKGIKGARHLHYGSLWLYESREAWEALWGTPDHPIPPEEYSSNWKAWETEVLAPYLTENPDQVTFTAYIEL